MEHTGTTIQEEAWGSQRVLKYLFVIKIGITGIRRDVHNA
jgi:hypothetical protein